MIVVEIYNQTKYRVNKKKLTVLTKFVLKKLNKKYNVSIVLVGKKEMKRINKLYRGIDKATDSLSFSYSEEMFGEILICPEYIRNQTKLLKVDHASLYEAVLIHSVLHVCGYDHVKQRQAEAMEKIEKKMHNEFKHIRIK